MANAVKTSEIGDGKAAARAAQAKGKAAKQARQDAKTSFDGKTFDSLTGPEKDELLKALAISAGIIAE